LRLKSQPIFRSIIIRPPHYPPQVRGNSLVGGISEHSATSSTRRCHRKYSG